MDLKELADARAGAEMAIARAVKDAMRNYKTRTGFAIVGVQIDVEAHSNKVGEIDDSLLLGISVETTAARKV